jgi:ABC-type Na+ efflux pump permease subunit
MRKILTIAAREYRAMVGTKAFLISVTMMPILMLGGILAMELLKNVSSVKERTIAVIDHEGSFLPVLDEAAERQRQFVHGRANGEASPKFREPDVPGMSPESYRLEKIDPANVDDQLRLQLSERVRNQELYAIVEIPKDVLKPGLTEDNKVQFYAQDSSLSVARRWIEQVINQYAKDRRIAELGLTRDELRRFNDANSNVQIVGQGLMTETAEGEIQGEKETDVMTAIFLPMGVMLLMFMVIFMAAQPMLESVLEEKSQRIAEVLLGSANPFQLMMGKLLGTVGGSLTIFAIYLTGAFAFATYREWTHLVPFRLIPWFIVFQIAGVLFYASIFMAVGASVSQLKEAQSMLLPVWMLLMAPLFVWFAIVRDPTSAVAMIFSYFPPTTPTTMILRMATPYAIPWWEPVLGLILTLGATLVVVVLAGRIFRIGILWQGKTPKLGEVLKWAIVGR